MDTTVLKNFAQKARVDLMHQIGAQLKLVLAPDSLARREQEQSVETLEGEIKRKTKEVVIEEVAYTWFNRFCALRFMDVNHYNPAGVVSPSDGQTQPEILSDAKMGIFDEDAVPKKTQNIVLDLLSGRLKSKDAQGEAYRLLLVSYCNHLNKTIPYLFEPIADYTELLLPVNLLGINSILADCRNALTEDACKDAEVIGWLYQYYISEKKDDVFKDFKKGKKAGPREIPAATQLFTPHWIVRYLVENSLGRLWMLNNPRSNLVTKMEYYIKPEQEESDFLRISKPEEIKVCDPACGSGHMLIYAFDLLYSIYDEKGYDPASIPFLILKNNLYGIEIDERAEELAAFALTMKARQRSRRFFNNPVEPNICVLKNVKIEPENLKEYVKHVGIDLFTEDVLTTLGQFKEADNFGSLIIPATNRAGEVLKALSQKGMEGEMFLLETHNQIITALTQAEYLSRKYHVVVANPPYMGGKNMNATLSDFAKREYPNSKSDMCTMFIERNLKLVVKQGNVAMITMQSWMFLSSFERLRESLIKESTITSMAHLGARAFDSIGGEVVSTTAFVIENQHLQGQKGSFVRLVDGGSEEEKVTALKEAIKNPACGWFYRVSADDFQKIPGSPIAYWVSQKIFNIFQYSLPLKTFSKGSTGLQTSNSDKFLRFWQEVDKSLIHTKWIPFAKGGGYRKWYGNVDHLVNWDNNGKDIKNYVVEKYPYLKGNYGLVVKNENTYFLKGILTSRVTTGKLGFRIKSSNEIYSDACTAIFPNDLAIFLSLLSSKLLRIIEKLNPTINFQAGDIEKFPIMSHVFEIPITDTVNSCLRISQLDWDAYEDSRDFTSLPLLDASYRGDTLATTYENLRAHWNEMTLEMQRLEEENNRIFIEAYGLEDELTPDVPLNEITLTCNPHYRYSGEKSDAELEELLLADTIRELISYAVGCMFGRYSLDEPGLILANQGETYSDYCRLVPDSSFPADKDNAIPVLDGDWFSDDIVTRFRRFVRIAFGEKRYEENLRFIESALGKDIRQYFLKDFYNDHVKRYKKRPIYWMFSSPDGSFNVLIYMHRYRPDTASIILNEYLREYQVRLSAYMENLRRKEANPDLSKGEKVRVLKELDKLNKTQDVLSAYERDVFFPLANRRIEIDLDDGVKVNYPKFYPALKKIAGLEARNEE